MSVCLDYRSTKAVSREVRDAIEAELRTLEPPHGWWAESLHFFGDDENDNHLVGSTKIFLSGYSGDNGDWIEVDCDEDSLMAYRDVCFILSKLAEWSRKHGIAWDMDCVGEPVGNIIHGEYDQRLQQFESDLKASFPPPAAFDE